MTKFSN